MTTDATKWIEEQKRIRMFRLGGNKSNDADRMLEIGETNRYLRAEQAQMIVALRFTGKVLGVQCLDELCDLVESAQLITDGRSRDNFMKVAIEQWQAKLAAMKKMRQGAEIMTE